MRDGTDEIIKTKLYGEIETLEKQYCTIILQEKNTATWKSSVP